MTHIFVSQLTHWDRVTHICVSKLTIIDSDNGLSPGRRQAIIWTNVGILLIGPLGTNFSEMLIEIHTFSFKKIHLKMSSGKWRPFWLALNALTGSVLILVMGYRLFGANHYLNQILSPTNGEQFVWTSRCWLDTGQVVKVVALPSTVTSGWFDSFQH